MCRDENAKWEQAAAWRNVAGFGHVRAARSVVTMIAAGLLLCSTAHATSVAVVGLFRDKAIVTLDGGKPRTLAVGQQVGEVRLIRADSSRAEFDVGGQRRVLGMGQSFAQGPTRGARASVTLTSDARGHFLTAGAINGNPVHFLVDTGATAVVVSTQDARRMGLDYASAERVAVGTANGQIRGWRVNFSQVSLGQVALNHIEGLVLDTVLPYPLLGASFLNRMEMRREGVTMTLTQRY